MALHLECGNGHEVFVPDCSPACAAIEGAHLNDCPGRDLDSLLTCPPGSGCCELPHHHGEAANACPLIGTDPDHHHALPAGDTVGNPECGVCRPMKITFYDGGNPASLALVTG